MMELSEKVVNGCYLFSQRAPSYVRLRPEWVSALECPKYAIKTITHCDQSLRGLLLL